MMKVVTMVMALIFGSPEDPSQQPSGVHHLVQERAVVSSHLNMSEFRSYMTSQQELMNFAMQGQNPEEAFAMSAMQISQMMGIPQETVEDAFTGIQGVHFWLLGLGQREENTRFLAVIDRGIQRREILGDIMDVVRRQMDDYIRVAEYSFAGHKVYGVLDRRMSGIMLTEIDGKIAIAMDPLTIERFVLKAKSPQEASIMPVSDAIFSTTVNDTLFNWIAASISRYEREEFYGIGAALGFSSMESLDFRFNRMGEVSLDLHMHPESHFKNILQGPSEPAQLAKHFSYQTPLGGVLALENASHLWKHLESVAQLMAASDPRGKPFTDEMKEELSRVGVDVEQDLFGNVAEVGFIAGDLPSLQYGPQNFFVLMRAHDAQMAQETIQRFSDAMGGDSEPAMVDGGMSWSVQGGRLVLMGQTLVIGEDRTFPDDLSFLNMANTASVEDYSSTLANNFPNATSFLTSNVSSLMPSEMEPLSLGLGFSGNTLSLRLKVNTGEISRKAIEFLEHSMQGAGDPFGGDGSFENGSTAPSYEDDMKGYPEEEYYEEGSAVEAVPAEDPFTESVEISPEGNIEEDTATTDEKIEEEK